MAKGLITQQNLEDIADAIRGKNNSLTEYKPSEMAAAVAAIQNSYTAGDEGKVVKNGALIAQTARATDITVSGTYDTTENNSVTVHVSGFLVPPLQYVTNSHYYTALGDERYYSETIQTCASFALTIGKKYVLFLDGNPGARFRRTQLDTEPFTIVPTNPPAPGSLEEIVIQTGIAVGTKSYDPPTENPPANASVTFTATKPYLAVHLSNIAGQAPNVYLLEMPS